MMARARTLAGSHLRPVPCAAMLAESGLDLSQGAGILTRTRRLPQAARFEG